MIERICTFLNSDAGQVLGGTLAIIHTIASLV